MAVYSSNDWRWHAERYEHYEAVQIDTIHLDDEAVKPWAHVVEARPGGLFRHAVPVSVSLVARDPATGLKFQWSEDLEPRGAGGTPALEILTDKLAGLIERVPADARGPLVDQLRDLRDKNTEHAREYHDAVKKLERAAGALGRLTHKYAPREGAEHGDG